MSKYVTILGLACLGCSSLAAADGDYWLRFTANAWNAELDGDIEYAAGAELGSEAFSVSELGLDDAEVTPYIEASVKLPLLFTLYAGYSGFRLRAMKLFLSRLQLMM